MVTLASQAKYRQRVVRWAEKHGAVSASDRFRVSRSSVYRWQERYKGSWKDLLDRSHRPHHHPREHTPEEISLIKRHLVWNKEDRMVLWMKIREKGYTRNYRSMCRFIRKHGMAEKSKPRKGYKPKPYAAAEYPGQKVQIDVKYVPSWCVAGDGKYYQYTAIDECTRLVYREMYDEHSTYSSQDFIRKVIAFFPFKIEMVQTDNGTEWTNALIKNEPTPTLFEEELNKAGIAYKRIRIATPRHNGKVERQHRIDEARFYRNMRMYSLEDGRAQLKKYNRFSNTVPKTCLGFRSPLEVLEEYRNKVSEEAAG